MKYYAVKVGKKPGIYDSWEECKENVIGFKDAIYKSFSSLEDAKCFIDEKNNEQNLDGVIAYVDGSYNVKTNEYSFGAILIMDEILEFKMKFENDQYSESFNVAGEIRGAGFIIQKAINLGIKKLHLYYDYMGIENWYNGTWKANREISIKYQEFSKKAKEKIEVVFHKVKSHSNNKYNDLVDKLAKEALGIK